METNFPRYHLLSIINQDYFLFLSQDGRLSVGRDDVDRLFYAMDYNGKYFQRGLFFGDSVV